jgi:hypothetical protein
MCSGRLTHQRPLQQKRVVRAPEDELDGMATDTPADMAPGPAPPPPTPTWQAPPLFSPSFAAAAPGAAAPPTTLPHSHSHGHGRLHALAALSLSYPSVQFDASPSV